jgi:hypothetical protein
VLTRPVDVTIDAVPVSPRGVLDGRRQPDPLVVLLQFPLAGDLIALTHPFVPGLGRTREATEVQVRRRDQTGDRAVPTAPEGRQSA